MYTLYTQDSVKIGTSLYSGESMESFYVKLIPIVRNVLKTCQNECSI